MVNKDKYIPLGFMPGTINLFLFVKAYFLLVLNICIGFLKGEYTKLRMYLPDSILLSNVYCNIICYIILNIII